MGTGYGLGTMLRWICGVLFHVHSSQLEAEVIPALFKIRKLRLREGQQLAQGHTAMEQHHSFN